MDVRKQRIERIRQNMREKNIDAFLLTKFDPHQSEYSKDNWNYVKYFSGFTGSAGTVVITLDQCAFWTDGRYALQSKNELAGTDYIIFNTANTDCPAYEEFIGDNVKENGVISFDERTLSMEKAEALLTLVSKKGIRYVPGREAVENAITDSFDMQKSQSFIHDVKYCGMDRLEKLRQIQAVIKEKGGTHYVLSALEDIAWLYNVRSRTEPMMSFEAYTVISGEGAVLFADAGVVEPVKDALLADGIQIRDYNDIFQYIPETLDQGQHKIIFAPGKTCFALYGVIKAFKTIEIPVDITAACKAVKNPVEIENTKKTSIIDGASLVKFIMWVKEAAKSQSVTEYEAGIKLNEIRAREETFVLPSFSTICGYGPNGAIIHYRADEKTSSIIRPKGFLLVDSGGNYLGGTTDITRTIVLGPLSEEMKIDFTLVLKCHIALATAVFLEGSPGHYIDILARRSLWAHMKDYKHGTGHGIGFALSVHEGPQRIAFQGNDIPIEPGMMISNEPGFYKDNEYGIRSENIVLAVERGESQSGRFYGFETLSFAPFDLEAIQKDLLTEDEIKWLNNYHKAVYDNLSPELDDNEKAWLKEATRSI